MFGCAYLCCTRLFGGSALTSGGAALCPCPFVAAWGAGDGRAGASRRPVPSEDGDTAARTVPASGARAGYVVCGVVSSRCFSGNSYEGELWDSELCFANFAPASPTHVIDELSVQKTLPISSLLHAFKRVISSAARS